MTREQILTAALEEIASGAFCHGVSGGNCPTGYPRDKARAALEAAAKADRHCAGCCGSDLTKAEREEMLATEAGK